MLSPAVVNARSAIGIGHGSYSHGRGTSFHHMGGRVRSSRSLGGFPYNGGVVDNSNAQNSKVGSDRSSVENNSRGSLPLQHPDKEEATEGDSRWYNDVAL